jgi:hypothetical protein
MNQWPASPVVYEINTWVWLNSLSQAANQTITLENLPQAELERLAGYHFDAVWLMGVWQRSPKGCQIAREHPGLQGEYQRALPGYRAEDVVGSPYAIHQYQVDPRLGGNDALAKLRERLQQLGLRLILDFVPNHMALDHPWVAAHPAYLLQTSAENLRDQPQNYFRQGEQIFAYGRDPYFDGWSDTVQIDYRRPDTRQAMTDILLDLTTRCDGVRCDMAMLVTHGIFLNTWGGQFDPPGTEFWPPAIAAIKAARPDFLMMAEVYWDMEWYLQQQGFDFTYDKRLYDRLLGEDVPAIRSHLYADLEYQCHLARFIENHDEPRAVATFGPQRSRAVALLSLALPGLRLLHEGQMEGWRLKLPVQLGRRTTETPLPDLEPFYRRLTLALHHPVFHAGQWQLLEPREAWAGNSTHQNFVIYSWELNDERRLVVVNPTSVSAQCYLPFDRPGLAGRTLILQDLLHEQTRYERNGDELLSHGLYLDLAPYEYHLFELQRAGQTET